MLITDTHARQFREDGYCVLEGVLSAPDLNGLRAECQRNLALQIAAMDRVGADVLGLSHKHKRYFLADRHDESAFLSGFLGSDPIVDIVRSTLGNDAFLFLILFVMKWRRTGTPFGWHQDSGYLLGNPHKPYVTLWFALDDMTVENGALHVLPHGRAGSGEIARHVKDKKTNDLIGYAGTDPGIALPVPRGSVVVLSSTVFHRSGPNTTDAHRSAFLASFSPEPITDRTGRHWNLAVPFVKEGQRIFEPAPPER